MKGISIGNEIRTFEAQKNEAAPTCIISFLTFGTSEKKNRAKIPAATPKPAIVIPLREEPLVSLSRRIFWLDFSMPARSTICREGREGTEESKGVIVERQTYNRPAVLMSMPWKFFRIL